MGDDRKGWREVLFGKASPPRTAINTPVQRSEWEIVAEQRRNTGQVARDWLAALRGQPQSPVRVCPEGHPVVPGSTTCSYGHYVG